MDQRLKSMLAIIQIKINSVLVIFYLQIESIGYFPYLIKSILKRGVPHLHHSAKKKRIRPDQSLVITAILLYVLTDIVTRTIPNPVICYCLKFDYRDKS